MSPAQEPAELDLLAALLAGEQACVYGYGVLGAHLLDPAQRTAAAAADDAHRARRDELRARLQERGAEPGAGLAAYGIQVRDATGALALAIRLEEGMAVRWRDLVAGSTDRRLRELAVGALTAAAVRAAQWRRWAGRPSTVPLPGVT